MLTPPQWRPGNRACPTSRGDQASGCGSGLSVPFRTTVQRDLYRQRAPINERRKQRPHLDRMAPANRRHSNARLEAGVDARAMEDSRLWITRCATPSNARKPTRFERDGSCGCSPARCEDLRERRHRRPLLVRPGDAASLSTCNWCVGDQRPVRWRSGCRAAYGLTTAHQQLDEEFKEHLGTYLKSLSPLRQETQRRRPRTIGSSGTTSPGQSNLPGSTTHHQFGSRNRWRSPSRTVVSQTPCQKEMGVAPKSNAPFIWTSELHHWSALRRPSNYDYEHQGTPRRDRPNPGGCPRSRMASERFLVHRPDPRSARYRQEPRASRKRQEYSWIGFYLHSGC